MHVAEAAAAQLDLEAAGDGAHGADELGAAHPGRCGGLFAGRSLDEYGDFLGAGALHGVFGKRSGFGGDREGVRVCPGLEAGLQGLARQWAQDCPGGQGRHEPEGRCQSSPGHGMGLLGPRV
ncbi:MAG: hypothetical protein CVU73_01900 [Deltaproteobacteria bacterium HGW-Deltaproteobacteria-8]|nr:MAG: hypothetical protein CVU73_01900 [Deltaproteobacteria bacterium HGW-Deltaproteobacteria-8]